ncbi:MAG: D-glycero-beta-D-manno-heptose 1,7-bisphosphate 7-phosphatase [Burkholderia sp.]|uniref:D-glycero-beta-D-manno-heptose 1,7-bisphosphate 7-phosphatase n=2 Tax=Burkholderiaceae TaxID=119060 RepID=UPI001CA3BD47|nr:MULTISPECIES: D-glycero-beta-D-manno-heptose 1,7-bisphosphate 7-phosphatase [Burkholderia]MBY8603551.1 D-glycero-beta-D-manno-heptose 1,7-bisphosphate 7-phosphatase [Burkholderia arboris]MCA3776280.1 D-glycero-beta-D-manno-heptose 1,7-bisphosphate 7-phosphatase [Burkholderia sp.]MCA3790905.1 D-glycero-beta-D-manno-heptose 1,7-bisphosphate 7-phosphatase [Burkholderia sp.]MCA3804542.1 D-glycero-beta-D-manno-heptose 1,7-bisphosphate 7-phosphatase [Burkholderia sp.]MCA3814814.1 D-glycero-beta-D
MKRKALFLDRDGVINVDYGYVHRQQDCVFVDGIFDLVRLANETGHQVVIVTNQAGIGRGYFSESQFVAFMDWMRRRFDERGARIDRVYFCPHHPVAGMGRYRQACACRKPQPGMLHDARRDLGLDLSASILVGDKRSDLDAGARAGVGRRFLFVGDRPGDADADPSAEVVARLADIGAALQGNEIAAMRA